MATERESLFRKALYRKLGAFFLITFTANPVTWSFLPWIAEEGFTEMPALKLLIIVLLIWAYTAYVRATVRSLGGVGIFLGVLGCGLAIWEMLDRGWIEDISDPDTLAWCTIFTGTFVLGTGMVWSFVRRRMSGQLDPTEA